VTIAPLERVVLRHSFGNAHRRRGRLRTALVLELRPRSRPRSPCPADSALHHEHPKSLSAGTRGEGVCALVRQVNDRHLVQALLALDQSPPKALPAYPGEERFGLPPDHSGSEGDFPIARSRAFLITGLGSRGSVRTRRIGRSSGRARRCPQHEGGPSEEGRDESAFHCASVRLAAWAMSHLLSHDSARFANISPSPSSGPGRRLTHRTSLARTIGAPYRTRPELRKPGRTTHV